MLETVTFKSSVQIALLLDHQRSSQGTKQKQMTFLSSWVMKESGIFWPRAGRPSDPSLRLSELQSQIRRWWSWRRDWPLPRYSTKIKGQIYLQMIWNTWIWPSVQGKKWEYMCMLETNSKRGEYCYREDDLMISSGMTQCSQFAAKTDGSLFEYGLLSTLLCVQTHTVMETIVTQSNSHTYKLQDRTKESTRVQQHTSTEPQCTG